MDTSDTGKPKKEAWVRPCPGAVVATLVVFSVLAGANAADPARKDFFAHPVLTHSLDPDQQSRLERDVQDIMKMTDAQIRANVPYQTARIHNGCPNCRVGKKDRSRWEKQEPGRFRAIYDPFKPDRYQCPDCKMYFPDNDRYPLDHEEVMENPRGEEIKIRYFLDPKGLNLNINIKEPQPRKYYLEGVLDTTRDAWLSDRMYKLALLYRITGNEVYARKAIVALNGYADRFPHWLMTGNYGHGYRDVAGMKSPYGWTDTRAGRRAPDEVNGPNGFLKTYDLVSDSKSMDTYSREVGENLREKVWNNVIKLVHERSMDYGIQWGQCCPGMKLYNTAMVFERPDLIRKIIQALEDTPRMSFGADGGYFEGPGYTQIELMGLMQMRKLNGYSDPAEFLPSDGKPRVKNFQYPTGEYETFFKKAFDFMPDIRTPNGGHPIFNDCGHGQFIAWQSYGPRQRSRNVMKYGLKHAVLGDGEEDRQIQVHLGFGENSANHGQQDTLGLQMFAFGHYLIDDFAYHKSVIRRYVEMTVGHNTVVIDQQNQGRYYTDGDPLLYEPRLPGLAVVKVDAKRVYPACADRYARTLILNTTELDRPYLIDLFQVKGGKIHDYFLRSSAFHEQKAEISLAMEKMEGERPLMEPGETWTEPIRQRIPLGSGYGLFFNVRKAAATESFTLDYQCLEPWKEADYRSPKNVDLPYRATTESWKDAPPIGTRHHFVVAGLGYEAYLFDSPNPPRSGFYGQTGKKVIEWPRMPHFMLRHKGEEGEEALFVAVHEPWYGQPSILSVKKIDTGRPNALVLRIEFADRKDTLIISTDEQVVNVDVDGTVFSGRLGFIAARADGKTDSYLVGGTKLRNAAQGVDLKLPRDAYTGTISKSLRRWNSDDSDAFAVEAATPLPEGDALAGAWILLNNNGECDIHQRASGKPAYASYMETTAERLRALAARGDRGGGAEAAAQLEKLKAVDDKMRKMGGAWSFEIARVEKRGGETLIHLTGDHGMEINGKACTEYFFPQRPFTGALTRFTIYPATSNQGRVEVRPGGGAFAKAVDVQCRNRVPGAEVLYAVKSSEEEPVWKKYTGPVHIDRDCELLVKSVTPGGIRQPLHQSYRFSMPIAACQVDAAKLTRGLLRTTYIGLGEESKAVAVEAVNKVDAQDFVRNYLIPKRATGRQLFKGFIKIGQPGVYTFHYRPDNDGSLTIGTKKLVELHGREATPMPRTVNVSLKKGFYPIEIDHYIKQGTNTRWTASFDFQWEGPGIKRCDVPAGALFHMKGAEKHN